MDTCVLYVIQEAFFARDNEQEKKQKRNVIADFRSQPQI